MVNATFAVWIHWIFVHIYPYKTSMQITTYFFGESAFHISNCTLSEHVLHWLCLFGYLLTVVLGFWEPCWELFWSINQCSIRSIRLRSIHLWSIRNEVYIWPNFFSRSRLRSNRSLIFSVKVDQKPFGQSKIWSIRVLQY